MVPIRLTDKISCQIEDIRLKSHLHQKLTQLFSIEAKTIELKLVPIKENFSDFPVHVCTKKKKKNQQQKTKTKKFYFDIFTYIFPSIFILSLHKLNKYSKFNFELFFSFFFLGSASIRVETYLKISQDLIAFIQPHQTHFCQLLETISCNKEGLK